MPNNSQKKTDAKRIGVKSVLLHGNENITITTFGKGNKAEVAIQTDKTGSNLAQKYEERNLTAQKLTSAGFEMLGTIGGDYLDPVILANPADRAGEDYLQLKGTLEKEFFSEEFPNDNVRIQIIHNILDIQKILGLYVNDIIYCVNNLRDDFWITYKDEKGISKTSEEPDIVGTGSGKQKGALPKMRHYFGFFGKAFRGVSPKPEKGKDGKLTNQAEFDAVDNYNLSVLAVLNELRQVTAHYKNCHKIFLQNEKLWKELKIKKDIVVSCSYNQQGKKLEVCENLIENAYTKRTADINSKFLDHSKVNLRILFRLFNDVKQDEIIEGYYRFSILKEGKNIGLNMTKLRMELLKNICRISLMSGTIPSVVKFTASLITFFSGKSMERTNWT
jgi:hypothetical protein